MSLILWSPTSSNTSEISFRIWWQGGGREHSHCCPFCWVCGWDSADIGDSKRFSTASRSLVGRFVGFSKGFRYSYTIYIIYHIYIYTCTYIYIYMMCIEYVYILYKRIFHGFPMTVKNPPKPAHDKAFALGLWPSSILHTSRRVALRLLGFLSWRKPLIGCIQWCDIMWYMNDDNIYIL